MDGMHIPNNDIDMGMTSSNFPGYKEANKPELTPRKIAKRIE